MLEMRMNGFEHLLMCVREARSCIEKITNVKISFHSFLLYLSYIRTTIVEIATIVFGVNGYK